MSSLPVPGAHPFPLIKGGGLFLLLVGLSIMIGTVTPRRIWTLLIAGASVASVVEMATAVRLTASLGTPSVFQIETLAAAVLIEALAIAWIGRRFHGANERRRTLSILLVVGAHFFLMGPAFGPLVVILGVFAVANAATGLRTAATSWLTFWFIDGVLKAGIGATMFWYAPRITWW